MLNLAAFSAFQATASDSPIDYRQTLTDLTGQPVRRLSRFAALALTGAVRLKAGPVGIRSDCALYFCSEQPNITDMVRVVHGIAVENRPPSPLEFLAVSSNITGFHAAKLLDLRGPNLTLCRSDASFEAGLELAILTRPQFGGSLVSYVEDSSLPLRHHRIRLGLPECTPIAECSHWLYFDRDCARPLAVIEGCEHHPTLDAAQGAISAFSSAGVTDLGFGVRMGPEECDGIQRRFGAQVRRLDEGASPPFSKGRTAYALCRFAERGTAGRLLNINRTASGEVYLVTMRIR